MDAEQPQSTGQSTTTPQQVENIQSVPTDPLSIIASLDQNLAIERTLQVLYSKDSTLRALIGRGEITLESTNALPKRFEVKSFCNGTQTYFYPVIHELNFSTGDELISSILEIANSTLSLASKFLRDQDLVVEGKYARPDMLGFPFEDFMHQSSLDFDLRNRTLEFFRVTSTASMFGKAITVKTFDDPIVAQLRNSLLTFSRSSMSGRLRELTDRQNCIQRSSDPVSKHMRSLAQLEYANPTFSFMAINNFFSRMSMPSELVADHLFDLAMISFRPSPLPAMDLSVQTGYSVNKTSALTPFFALPTPTTFATDLAMYLKSLLAPGHVLLNINFDSTIEAQPTRGAYAILAHLLCMYSDNDMWCNITRETRETLNIAIDQSLLQGKKKPRGEPLSELLPFMNKLTPNQPTDSDPMRDIYRACIPRKEYFIACSDINNPLLCEQALEQSTPITRFRELVEKSFPDASVAKSLPLFMKRFSHFFSEWNSRMRVTWYNGFRTDTATFNQLYDVYSSHSVVYNMSIESLMYIFKTLTSKTLIISSTPDDTLRAEIGLAHDCMVAYQNHKLITYLVGRFNLQLSFTTNKIRMMAVSQSPVLKELAQQLDKRGMSSSLDALFGNCFIDTLMLPLYNLAYTFDDNRLLFSGILDEIIINESSFRLRASQIRSLIRSASPYRNITDRENQISPSDTLTLDHLFSFKLRNSLKLWIDDRENPFRIKGFFPLRIASSTPPSQDVFPINFNLSHNVAYAYSAAIMLRPISIYTRVFEAQDFVYPDDFVLSSTSGVCVSIPSRVHYRMIVNFEDLLGSSHYMSVSQMVIAASLTSFISPFALWS